MENCIFCQIIEGKIPADKVFENEYVLAFLDINPVNNGHTLVIPQKHFASLEEVEEKYLCEMMKLAQKIGSSLNEAVGASGFNLGLNNGKDAGQVVGHVHLHIMPRFSGDGLKLWPGKETTSGERAKIAEAIKKSID